MEEKMRKTGILLPIFSLPNEYGIGTLGKDAYHFIDFLNEAKQSYWQILPVTPTSYGDSPYQSFCVFAGNPYFIDFDILKDKGLLKEEEYSYLKIDNKKIDYAHIYNTRFKILKIAYERFDKSKLDIYIKANNYWLEDYAVFMSIKKMFNENSFLTWPDEYKLKNKKTIEAFKQTHQEDIYFWYFVQYEFNEQMLALIEYAHQKNILLIGDLPIYTSLDSSDVWGNKKLFLLDDNMCPSVVAGCPPDYFSPKGQLWGNPIYNYAYMKKTNYEWWIKRIKAAATYFDVIRIDHFRGFEAYYTIPYGASDAVNGKWVKGPNVALFNAIKKELGNINIIAENLGFLTKEVDEMLEQLGYPGMKIMQFGFEKNMNSDSALHNLTYNTVVYPGTHDNPPIRGWYNGLTENEKQYLHDYLYFDSPYEVTNNVVRAALSSVCKLAIIPMQDYLQQDESCRINTPSTANGNWCYRIEKGDMNNELAAYIANLVMIYHRE